MLGAGRASRACDGRLCRFMADHRAQNWPAIHDGIDLILELARLDQIHTTAGAFKGAIPSGKSLAIAKCLRQTLSVHFLESQQPLFGA